LLRQLKLARRRTRADRRLLGLVREAASGREKSARAVHRDPKVERKGLPTFSTAETAAAIAALRPARIFIPAILGLMYGMRRGEIVRLSSRRCRPHADGYRLRASVPRQEFVLLQELLDQVGKDGPRQGAAAEWNAGDILAADSGEMGNDLTGFVSAEDKPWVPFVCDATVSPNGRPGRPHELGRAVQMREFMPRPALPVGPHLGKDHCPANHR